MHIVDSLFMFCGVWLVSRVIGHSIGLRMAWACRGMSLETVVRFMQYLSLLLVLRYYTVLKIVSEKFQFLKRLTLFFSETSLEKY